VFDDFDRFFDHLTQGLAADAPARIQEIIEAVEILGHSPLIGRKVKSGRRELVIGRGSRGYVALYRFVPGIDTVFVLAFRSQRETGYQRDE
jgi:plasmid stabilization system protein ParE